MELRALHNENFQKKPIHRAFEIRIYHSLGELESSRTVFSQIPGAKDTQRPAHTAAKRKNSRTHTHSDTAKKITDTKKVYRKTSIENFSTHSQKHRARVCAWVHCVMTRAKLSHFSSVCVTETSVLRSASCTKCPGYLEAVRNLIPTE